MAFDGGCCCDPVHRVEPIDPGLVGAPSGAVSYEARDERASENFLTRGNLKVSVEIYLIHKIAAGKKICRSLASTPPFAFGGKFLTLAVTGMTHAV